MDTLHFLHARLSLREEQNQEKPFATTWKALLQGGRRNFCKHCCRIYLGCRRFPHRLVSYSSNISSCRHSLTSRCHHRRLLDRHPTIDQHQNRHTLCLEHAPSTSK